MPRKTVDPAPDSCGQKEYLLFYTPLGGFARDGLFRRKAHKDRDKSS
jgi:hypothetical protein